MAGTILIVEDEPAIAELIDLTLKRNGHQTICAGSVEEAIRLIDHALPDLALIDWMLPGGTGIELLRRLKKEEATQGVPVIMLTAKAHEDNVIQGLEVGADDYMTKPFAPKELLARMRALLRRTVHEDVDSELRVGNLVIELNSHRVIVDGKALDMGPTEFKLLQFFMSNPDRVYSRAQLLDRVWGVNIYVEERTVDVHIRRLRKALQAGAPRYSDLVQTVRGVGYRFSDRDIALT